MSSLPLDEAAPRDARLEQLRRWLESLFGAADFDLAPASADASFRRYFRVTRAGETWIAMDAPPDKEDMEPYVRIASMLADVGVNEVHLMPLQGDPVAFVRSLGHHVVPRLSQL